MKTHSKRYILLLIAVICVIVVAVLVRHQKLFRNETAFDVPDRMKYVLVYSSGEFASESTQITYIDKNAEVISYNYIPGKTDSGAFDIDPETDHYLLFTHDTIYFDSEDIQNIVNKEMTGVYSFATDDGIDTVYNSGYINDIGFHFKYIPHGLSYSIKDNEAFDLIVLYNSTSVKNVRIIEAASIALDKDNSEIYAFDSEVKDMTGYERIVYDGESSSFTKSSGEIDLKEFLETYNEMQEPVTIHKTIIERGNAYLIVGIGEVDLKTMMIECSIDSDGAIQYSGAYPIPIRNDESISFDVPSKVVGNNIRLYSILRPNAIIDYDTVTKKSRIDNFLPEWDGEESLEYLVRIINDDVYVLKIDLDSAEFSILNVDDELIEIAKGQLPGSTGKGDYWIVDFYVNRDE